jgi:hypothetical protein
MSQPENKNTEIATVDSDIPVEVSEPTTGALQRLRAEVKALDEAYHWARAMSKTSMVPEAYQYYSKPRGETDIRGDRATYDLAAAVLYGSEIGLSAMQSAQNVFVVHGKPAVYARTMAGQVRAAGYVIEPVEESDERCVWKALRDGEWAFSEWTIERATQAGYTRNEKYQSNPQEMLRAKAIAEVCRIKFQDILLGMAYTIEELQLEQAVIQRVTKQGARGTAALREIAQQTAEQTPAEDSQQPQTDPTPNSDDNPEQEPDTRQSSNAQLAEIRKLYKARNISGQDLLDELSQYLQRKVERLDVASITFDDAVSILGMLTGKTDS